MSRRFGALALPVGTVVLPLLLLPAASAGPGATFLASVATGGSAGNGRSFVPAISGDGRFAAFYSDASNLVAGDTNDSRDVFVNDRQTGETTRMSVDSSGADANDDSFAPAISADGRFVAFSSAASNLVAGDTRVVGLRLATARSRISRAHCRVGRVRRARSRRVGRVLSQSPRARSVRPRGTRVNPVVGRR